MTEHLVVMPIVLPALFAAILLLPLGGIRVSHRRWYSLALMTLSVFVASWLLWQHTNTPAKNYLLGNWPEPFGILLVADQLSVLMVWLTTVLAWCVCLHSTAGDDEKGAYFHPLLHFLLMGLNGAFLTGDLFNLFVFFEVLLISSYGLLIHGGGKKRVQSALHYVLLNLVGSALFLLALALLYSLLGTLHLAEMAARVPLLDQQQQWLLQSAGALLLLVFGLKAALLPLHFWLPAAYSQASASVAAMFAVMTKVGVYSLIRVFGALFAADSGALAGYGQTLLLWGGGLTMVLATVLLVAAADLKKLSAAMVLLSAGILLSAVGFGDTALTAAALLYLVHSSWIGAVWFMLAERIGQQRGTVGDRLVPGAALKQALLLGWLFALSALVVIGMPPFSGFVSKIWLLQASLPRPDAGWYVLLLLVSSLLALVALSRAGSTIFWRSRGKPIDAVQSGKTADAAIMLLLVMGFLLVVAGQWWMQYCIDAVAQLTVGRGR
jgi:multicomponent K+:H+ antiporter subunit D